MIWVIGMGAGFFTLLAVLFLSPEPKSGTTAIVCFVVAVGLTFEFGRRFGEIRAGSLFSSVKSAFTVVLFVGGCIWLWEYAAWHLVGPTSIFPAPSTIVQGLLGGSA